MMNFARNADTPGDVDLQRTRQTFLFAREQLAANRCATVRDMGYSAPDGSHGGHAATDASDCPIQ
jgi:hypothetical protein